MNTKQFLDERQVDYKVYAHPDEPDASHTAAVMHIPGANLAKTVLLRADHGFRYIVAVLPSTAQLDVARIRGTFGGADVRLATELELIHRNPHSEAGVLTPFGSQIGAETIADPSLAEHADLFFVGDRRGECIRLSFREFCRLENPLLVPIAESGTASPPHNPLTASCEHH